MYRIRTVLELETQELEKLGLEKPIPPLSHHDPASTSAQRPDCLEKILRRTESEILHYCPRPTATASMLMPRDLSPKEASLKRLTELDKQQQAALEDLGRRSHESGDSCRNRIQHCDEEIVMANKKIQEFQNEEDMCELFNVDQT